MSRAVIIREANDTMNGWIDVHTCLVSPATGENLHAVICTDLPTTS